MRGCQYATCTDVGTGHDRDGWWLCAKHRRSSSRDEEDRANAKRTALAVAETRAKVAALHADGLCDQAIAERLHYAVETVRRHRRALDLPAVPPPGPACGTRWGYQRHMRSGEAVCAECRAAQRAYDRDYKRRTRAAARQRERVA